MREILSPEQSPCGFVLPVKHGISFLALSHHNIARYQNLLLWHLRGDLSWPPALILKRFAELNRYRNLIYNHNTAKPRLSAPLFITEANELMMWSCLALRGGIPKKYLLLFAVQSIDFPVILLLVYLKASGILQAFR